MVDVKRQYRSATDSTGTEPEFWLNLQQPVDLWDALHSDQAAELDRIQPASVG